MTDPTLEIKNQPNESTTPTQVEVYASRQGAVDLETDLDRLASHLERHSEWMERCLKPLTVYALSADDYKLQFFQISGLGFSLEPCFGVKVWSEPNYVYCLRSIPLPEDEALPYTVDCWSYYHLESIVESEVTRVNWKLKLHIVLDLPKFLQALPDSMVYQVGVRVINQVTRTMTDRLTRNVCTDYYQSIGRPKGSYKVVYASPVTNEAFQINLDDPDH